MRLEDKASEIELIAKAFQTISKEISYEGLVKVLLNGALGYCGAARGAVPLSEKGKLLDKADADMGVGIAPTSRVRIFDALYTTKGDGLGIGLSICRKIVAVHGGRLWVEENTTHGATFTFTLPLRQSVQMSGSH
jgi:K+-sensing histidine kinase KdpD